MILTTPQRKKGRLVVGWSSCFVSVAKSVVRWWRTLIVQLVKCLWFVSAGIGWLIVVQLGLFVIKQVSFASSNKIIFFVQMAIKVSITLILTYTLYIPSPPLFSPRALYRPSAHTRTLSLRIHSSPSLSVLISPFFSHRALQINTHTKSAKPTMQKWDIEIGKNHSEKKKTLPSGKVPFLVSP